MPNESPICSGLVDRIGLDQSTLKHKIFKDGGEEVFQISQPIKDHEEGLQLITDLLVDGEKGVLTSMEEVEAIGHRVVHGGDQFASTTIITDEVKQKIESLIELAPLHNPPNLLGIKVAERIFPKAKQVAVFDTAFHQSMPEKAYRYAIPNEFYTEMGIRAYGFHGSSHQYVSKIAFELLNKPDAKIITIHLGNGSSMAAVKGGKSMDNTMGLGPMGGLVMGTRCGDIDPSIIFYLLNQKGFSPKEVNELLNKKSGLLGMTGSSDMRDVKNAIEKGNKNATLAYEIYAYRIQKYIGAFTAVMNGLDAIVFTAGIGENDPDMRAAVCKNMDYFGIQVDNTANQKHSSEIREINPSSSKTKVFVIPTNEELEIGQQTYRIVKGEKI